MENTQTKLPWWKSDLSYAAGALVAAVLCVLVSAFAVDGLSSTRNNLDFMYWAITHKAGWLADAADLLQLVPAALLMLSMLAFLCLSVRFGIKALRKESLQVPYRIGVWAILLVAVAAGTLFLVAPFISAV